MDKLGDVLTRLEEKIQARSEPETGLTKPKAVPGRHQPSLLPDRHPIFAVAKIIGVPIDASVVKACEKIRLFAIGGQADVAFEHLVKPRGRSARGAHCDEIG